MFRGILLEKDAAGGQRVAQAVLAETQLPEGRVTVQVSHSTINLKDALAITGRSPIVRVTTSRCRR